MNKVKEKKNVEENLKERYPLMCYDVIFKSIFTNHENILAKMISDITGIDYKLLEDNITLETNELPISKKNEKAKRCDFIVRYNNNYIINLELNRQSHTGLIVKNLSYVFNLFSTNSKKGEEYDGDLMVMQININCFKKETLALSRYYIKEDTDNSIYTKNIILYSLNVVNCSNLYYNYSNKEIPKYIRWGALIYCDNFDKLPEICRGIMTYEERNIIMDKLDKLQKDSYLMSEVEALEWAEWEKNTIYSDGKKAGYAEAIEENTLKMIKSMLKEKIDYNVISKVTNKSIDEIKEIEQSLQD